MLKVAVSINFSKWRNLRVINFVKNVAKTAWDNQTKLIAPDSEISILLTDDAFIKDLNAKYRKMDKPTNVLSFPLDDDVLRGDIIVAYETVAKEAEAEGKTMKEHLALMITHGVLHLAGYDHIKDDEAEEMEELERIILTKIK